MEEEAPGGQEYGKKCADNTGGQRGGGLFNRIGNFLSAVTSGLGSDMDGSGVSSGGYTGIVDGAYMGEAFAGGGGGGGGGGNAAARSHTNQSGSNYTDHVNVFIETDGVGHVYVEVGGTVFSYGRYNGSYSPSSGHFGPYGEGVLLKKEGAEATDFIRERTSKFPTNSYQVEVNSAGVYSYLNNKYNNGSAVVNKQGQIKDGRVVDTYTLVGPGGNNCATIVCKGLNAGGANMDVFQSPGSLNLFLFNVNTMKKGWNPGLSGPKR